MSQSDFYLFFRCYRITDRGLRDLGKELKRLNRLKSMNLNFDS